jgi:hypothetical protein
VLLLLLLLLWAWLPLLAEESVPSESLLQLLVVSAIGLFSRKA